MHIPEGYHEIFLGYFIPGFIHKTVITVDGVAEVEVFSRGFSLYAGVVAPAPVNVAFTVMYYPLLPLAVAIYILLAREETARKLLAALVPLYTRFVKPLEALSNERRRAIYDYIKERGYSWPRELERVFNMAYGEVCWHLTVLERVGLIYNFYALRRRFYVNRGLSFDEAILKIFIEQAGREPREEEVLKVRRSCSLPLYKEPSPVG